MDLGNFRGLSQTAAQEKLKTLGFNEFSAEKTSHLRKALLWFVSPISLMLLAAAALSLAEGSRFDFYFILGMLALNFMAGFWQEFKADRALLELNHKLSAVSTVIRGGKKMRLPARLLVEGDVVELGVGDVVPADVKLLSSVNFSVNQSAITGESLPVEMAAGKTAYGGAFVATGLAAARITATGQRTMFGKTLASASQAGRRSLLETDILRISKFLSFLSLAAAVVLSAVLIWQRENFFQVMMLDLSLIIAGVPISLPAVMSLIISFGVLKLAGKKSIVRKLAALEDLANVDILLSDKTGTLTQNQIEVEKIIAYGDFSERQIVQTAALAAGRPDRDLIDRAIVKKAGSLPEGYNVVSAVPADSEKKRGSAVVKHAGQTMRVSVGATQVVAGFCKLAEEENKKFERDVNTAAALGFRSLAVAINRAGEEEKNMRLMGLLLLSDRLVFDAKESVEFLNQNGIMVKMLTGDNLAIGKRVAGDLGLKGQAVGRGQTLEFLENNPDKAFFQKYSAFCEILPADKLALARAAGRNFRVAVTGDGINDLPAIQAADVGFAVSGAVDALKSAADIVLTSPGIGVIKDAVVEARKIFARLYSYSIYRISESFRLIVTVAILGLWQKTYPLMPAQLILLAFLNDVPIISLAFNRVNVPAKPAAIKVRERFKLSSLYGLVGVANSIILFVIITKVAHLPWAMVQTIYFLKLTVSGHMLVFVAHTRQRWYRFLPSKQVMWATVLTQLVASLFAFYGIFMAPVPFIWIAAVWLWAFMWMQISELMKIYAPEV